MNYQGKNKLLIAIGLTVLLIIMSIILYIYKIEARGTLAIFFPILIVMALLGVLLSSKQVKRIERRINNLPTGYQSVYFNIHELLGTYGMLRGDKEEIMNMILEIFEHSYIEGRSVEDVIGKDIDTFVKGFVDETGKSDLFWGLLGHSTTLFIGYLLLIKAYEVIRTGEISMKTLESETFDFGLLITYFIISYICVPWLIIVIQRSTRYQWHGAKRILILIPVLVSASLFAGLILIDDPKIVNLITQPVHLFTNFSSIIVGILIMIGSIYLTKIKKD